MKNNKNKEYSVLPKVIEENWDVKKMMAHQLIYLEDMEHHLGNMSYYLADILEILARELGKSEIMKTIDEHKND